MATVRYLKLSARVEKARLAEEETGLRLVAWSSSLNIDGGADAEAQIPLPFTADGGDVSDTIQLGVALPAAGGTDERPWGADAQVWIGAHTFAPSEAGPLVGGRAGAGSIALRDLRDRVVRDGSDVVLELVMSQPGVSSSNSNDKVYRKMNVRITGVVGARDRRWVKQWSCTEATSEFDLVPSQMPFHDQLLEDYAWVQLYPYLEEAAGQGVGFAPSHEAIAPIHAPVWFANVRVPGWAFWIQTGVPVYDDPMREFLAVLARTALERHDLDVQDFVNRVDRQMDRKDDAYDDDFTYVVAAAMDACAIAAVSLYYRYDEAYRVSAHWFKKPTASKRQIESFHDALAMAGGDCEDLGSLIHRVFRWIQLGEPRWATRTEYWRAYGGWTDPVLDHMQRIFYWYVSGGALGSVTAARFTPQPGGLQALLIESDEDEKLPIGGHMWQEAMPVVKVEELMARMNSGGPIRPGAGTLRPDFVGRGFGREYPGWVGKLPHTIGEGTGAMYPLVLPLRMYMHTEDGRRRAVARHDRMIRALEFLQESTEAIKRLQIQRYSDRADPVADARVNYFYRRTTKFSTDDMALHGIPRFDLVWTRKGRRRREREVAFDIAHVPGEARPGTHPTWGVDMRDKILSANAGAFGDGKPLVALTVTPPVTDEEMASFKSRIRHLPKWRQPRRTAAQMRQVQRVLDDLLTHFRADVKSIMEQQRSGEAETAAADVQPEDVTRVNCIFRRNEFTIPRLRKAVTLDLQKIAARIARVEADTEMFDNDVYNVRLSLWVIDAPTAEG